ncbi:MAG: hypothetical protein IPM82_16510 [Saprospiraceae bacterium]|nr:hypothetical protein [Saprospiraceae bacterium]
MPRYFHPYFHLHVCFLLAAEAQSDEPLPLKRPTRYILGKASNAMISTKKMGGAEGRY